MSALPARIVTDAAKRPVKLMPMTVKTADGAQHSYGGLYPSTCDAVIDAIERFGIAKVSAEARP